MGNIFDDILSGDINLSNENLVIESTETSEEELFTEATDVKVLPRVKMVNRQVYLPKGQPLGKGNICFLYANSFNQSADMIGSRVNFLSNGRYKYYYYPGMYKGFVNTNLFNIRDTETRKEYYAEIAKLKGIKGYVNPRLGTNDNANAFIDLHKYLNILSESCYPSMPFSKYLSIYWTYMYKILDMNSDGSFDTTSSFLKKLYINIPYTTAHYANKFVLCNIDNYKLGKTLKENIRHPLFGLYYTLYRMPYMLKNLNVDFFFYTGRFVLVVNPSMVQDKKIVRQLRVEMMKLINKTSYREELADAVDEEKIVKSEIEDQAASKIADDMPNISSKEVDDQVSKIVTKKVDALNNVIVIPPEEDEKNDKETKVSLNRVITEPDKKDNTDKQISSSDENLANNVKTGVADAVTKQAEKEVDDDEELLRKIYDELEKTKPDATPMSARDREFREKLKNNQKDVAVKTMTVKDITKIRGKDIAIDTDDVSNVTTSMNDNMNQITFNNFEKTYNEKLMEKDLIASITALNDKSIPLYISSIDVKDTSDELNYKDTYTIHLIDANHKKQTIKVDIPKFVENKFLLIGGNKMLIKKQLFFYPVVKVNESTVHVTTNYNKIIIERVDTKHVPVTGRLNTLLKKSDVFKEYCEMGNAYVNNSDYITTVEYDSISKIIVSFKCNDTQIYFNQIEANEVAKNRKVEGSTPDKLFIGFNGKTPIYINTETAVGQSEKSVADYIIDALPQELQDQFESITPPKSNVFVRGQVMKKSINIGPLLGLWVGFTKLIKALNLEYRLENKIPALKADESYIKFKDCVFVYKATMTAMFILNGFSVLKTEQYNLTDFDVTDTYIPYLVKIYGRVTIENALYNFYEFLLDPITKEVCQDLNIPDNTVDLILYAVSLLSDNRYTPEINLGMSRIRSNEIVAAILYEKIAKNYINYRNSNGSKPLSIPQNSVIKELVGLKTVDNYSTLNPSLEMDMTHGISPRGFNGTNLDQAYKLSKRSYDKSMTGTIAVSNQPDGNVGVNKTLTLEPNIYGLRGYTKPYTGEKNSNVQTKDINLLSPVELTMPIATRYDDSTRLGHAVKQSRSVIPVNNSCPVLIANGFDEVTRFHLTSDFVINAEESGEIIDYDEKSNIMIARYKSGKIQAINLNPNIVKNANGGFFLANTLKTDLKVGSKFKANDVLAYHKDFFTNNKYNNCRMNLGTLAKVAIMSTYNTYQDGTFCTEAFSKKASTEMVFLKSIVVGKNSNIEYIVNKGDEIKVGESLIRFDESFDDDSLNALIANMNEEDKSAILANSRNDIQSKYSGVIEDIKIYAAVDLDEMSPTLKSIVSKHYRKINEMKEFLNKYDDTGNKNGVVKCGIILQENAGKTKPNQFGVIKGENVEDSVLFEFYIKHAEPLEIGSKIANFSAIKNTIDEVIPEGYEPYSDFRKDEAVDTIIASNSLLKRMTPSVLVTTLGNKCIVELKRSLESIWNKKEENRRSKMENLIYRFFNAMDESGKNTKYYKDIFTDMTDNEFKKYFDGFFKETTAYLILTIVDYEADLTLDEIERAAKVLGIPLFEYVYTPHLTMDKDKVVMTQTPVPVGYLVIKREQQTLIPYNHKRLRNIGVLKPL